MEVSPGIHVTGIKDTCIKNFRRKKLLEEAEERFEVFSLNNSNEIYSNPKLAEVCHLVKVLKGLLREVVDADE